MSQLNDLCTAELASRPQAGGSGPARCGIRSRKLRVQVTVIRRQL